jgi:phosphate butyryltransferase
MIRLSKRPANLEQLAELAVQPSARVRVAVARCANAFVLRAGIQAYESGLAEPVLIGDPEATRARATECGLDISRFELIPVFDDETAVSRAIDLHEAGEVGLIMKGLVPTATLLKGLLARAGKSGARGVVSHVAAFDSPVDGRLMLMTDAGVNIAPNLQRKVDIVKNALGVAGALGFEQPRTALLAATEKVNFPAMPATLDADLISKMGARGEFGDALVHGPLSLDLAVSKESAECKGVDHPVAGQADVLVLPDIESANVLYKSLTVLSRSPMAGVVVGTGVPVVVPSRGDTDRNKYFSLALSAYLASRRAA